ncbi:MAG: CPXCG motif-containing cysteine-rich protein [Gammaproteobacteria bacterium]|nr:MAG: CPXCG motif-containing cysteine-rich protein [Gammaproteobacteria bacterium]
MYLKPRLIQCPYCWQNIEILIDPSIATQDYIEDCSVCCRPVRLKIKVDGYGEPKVQPLSQDD